MFPSVDLRPLAWALAVSAAVAAPPSPDGRDPFRSLETEAGAATWIRTQNARTRAYMAQHRRLGVAARVAELLAVGTVGAPKWAGGRAFYLARRGQTEQAQLVWRDGDDERVLVDPGAAEAGPDAALDWYYPSRDGRLVAYGLSHAGDEESTLFVLDVATGAQVDGPIPHTRSCSVSWRPDGRGFVYTRQPPGGGVYHRKLYEHRLGQPWAHDRLAFGEGLLGKADWATPTLTPDGKHLLVHVTRGWTHSELYRVEASGGLPRRLFGGVEGAVGQPLVRGDDVLLVTTWKAPRGRLVRFPWKAAERTGWVEVVPEGPDVLEGFAVVDDQVLVHLVGAEGAGLVRTDLRGGSARPVPLPAIGEVVGLMSEPGADRALLVFSSFVRPPQILQWRPGDDRLHELASVAPPVPPEDFLTEHVEVPSYDGTRVPMFVIRRRDVPLDGRRPTLLLGYGGFGLRPAPSFQRNLLFWLERGGIVAVAGVRGGGERGRAWHEAGRREKKFQGFFDFEFAMRFLIREGYTRPDQLALSGASNGGLLVGAMATRVPHLFAAGIGAVGLYDMLRYDRFPPAQLWVDEYGDPADPAARGYLWAYSPYHQVLDGVRYPALYLATAARDSRVHWAHTAKFAARLQAAQAGPAPVLFWRPEDQGHGAGRGLADLIRDYTDRYTFLDAALGLGEGEP